MAQRKDYNLLRLSFHSHTLFLLWTNGYNIDHFFLNGSNFTSDFFFFVGCGCPPSGNDGIDSADVAGLCFDEEALEEEALDADEDLGDG